MNENTRNPDWTPEEVAVCVDRYIECLFLDINSQSFVKIEVYRNLSAQIGRTTKSIERKFQNISAVLDELGYEWISGLAPLRNYQGILTDAIELHIPQLQNTIELPSLNVFRETEALYLEQPPSRETKAKELPEQLIRLVRKFDPIARDLKLKAIGDAGEQLAFESEQSRLRAEGRPDLARKVKWIAKEDGDGAGYDILSYDLTGEKAFIEVKTTIGGNRTPFYISRNERAFAEEEKNRFRLMRLFDFRRKPKAFELRPPLEDHVNLIAENFRADFTS